MKKHIICSIITLLVFSIPMRAQDPTPKIKIGNVTVYESSDSIEGEGIQGHVSYDASSNTMMLNNATIESNLWAYGADKSFKVKLLGGNSIKEMMSSNDSCIFFGPGSLTLGNSTVDLALNCARTDFLALTEGATLEITASETGIYTLYDDVFDSIAHYPNLVVDSSSLIVTAPACCQFVWNWWLSGCHVVEPADFECPLDTWTFLSSGTILNYLEIRKGPVGLPENEAIHLKAWGVEGGLCIEGLVEGQAVEVVNMLGQVVYSAKKADTEFFVPLKHGVYVVHSNGYATKVVVK